ncbi:MAG: WYL domain-containing protein [Clostridia bacterium]|nr:WYL domain-containing protein [Clostridia bacterium]
MEKKSTPRNGAEVTNRKMRLLYFMDYMRINTDEKHPVSLTTVAKAMTDRGIYTTRKALYDDIEVLSDYGFEIIRAERGYKYYYCSPLFEFPELKMMIDIIYASSFVSEKKAASLIRRLKQFCSVHQAAELNRQLLTVNVKSKNEQTMYNVDTLYRAIAADRQVSFKYAEYATEDGKKHYRYGGKVYHASPYNLIYTDDQYYLLSYNSEKSRSEIRRVDRMENVTVSEDLQRDGFETIQKIDMRNYTRYTFGMFSNSPDTVKVTMRFTNKMRSVVYDRFGDVLTIPDDEHHFLTSVPISVSPQFFGWVLGLGKNVQIIRPESVREEMRNYLKEISSFYTD